MLTKENYPFSFDERACESCGGRCCTGQSGYIWINDDEILALSRLLGLNKFELISTYLYKKDGRFSIKEKPYDDGVACVFFDEILKNCSIYEARPRQCRTFPFWRYFITNAGELVAECPGIKFD